MYNGVISMLDLRLEVVYPIEYLEKAIPFEHKSRDLILSTCRQQLLNGDESRDVMWMTLINDSLFFHPRYIATQLFD